MAVKHRGETLYCVNVRETKEVDIYVLAENKEKAMEIAEEVGSEELIHCFVNTEIGRARTVEKGHRVCREWRDDYPYNNEERADKTVQEIISSAEGE